MLIERFTSYLQYEKRFSAHTLGAYVRDLHQFQNFLKLSDTEIIDAKFQDVRSWVVELMDKQTEPRSIQRKLSSLRTFFNFLQREELVESNPAMHVKAPKVAKRLPVFIEDSKLVGLLDAENVFPGGFEGLRDRIVLELLFGTGMRLAELLTLSDVDVNLYEQSIKVFGKRSKERIIPLNVSLVKMIKEYLAAKSEVHSIAAPGVLIISADGKPASRSAIHRIVQKYLSLVSTHKKRSPHVLRHSFATSLLNKGADLNAIKELLGHASLAATEVYTHNSVERLKLIYKQAHPKA